MRPRTHVTGNACAYGRHYIQYINMAETHFPAEQFRQAKAFSFQKLQFGSKGDQRIFHAERYDTLNWLHYTMSMQMLLSATLVCAARLYYSACSQIAIILQPDS